MKKTLVIKFQLPGIHCWPDVNIEQVDYLKYPHRHLFYIEAHVPVSESNREVEFIEFQYKLKTFLLQTYWSNEHKLLDFGHLSCEHICEFLLDNFKELSCVKVFEDNENGAVVER